MATNTGVIGGYSYNHITLAAPTTTVVKTGTGILHTVTLNKPTATSVITIYDGVDTSGAVIAVITVPTSPLPVTLYYDTAFTTGLTVVTATAVSDVTISYV